MSPYSSCSSPATDNSPDRRRWRRAAGSTGRYAGRCSRTRSLSTVMPFSQPIRSAITFVGIVLIRRQRVTIHPSPITRCSGTPDAPPTREPGLRPAEPTQTDVRPQSPGARCQPERTVADVPVDGRLGGGPGTCAAIYRDDPGRNRAITTESDKEVPVSRQPPYPPLLRGNLNGPRSLDASPQVSAAATRIPRISHQ